MEISLENIDIIRERTGVGYKEAKEALEKANGNLLDALVSLESREGNQWTKNVGEKGSEIVDRIKEIIKKGNITRIRVKKEDKIIMEIPVTAGALGALLIPKLTALGAVAALLSKCVIELDGPDSKVINVGEVVEKTVDSVFEKIDSANMVE